MAVLVYETEDDDFVERTLKELISAGIPCHRWGPATVGAALESLSQLRAQAVAQSGSVPTKRGRENSRSPTAAAMYRAGEYPWSEFSQACQRQLETLLIFPLFVRIR